MNSIRHKFNLARDLSFSEWFSLMEAWGLLLVFYLALRWMSFDSLKKKTPPLPKKNDVQIDTERLKRLVDMSARLHLLSMTCLPKSLTLRWMLIRRGAPAVLKIGVMKIPDGIQAHAWVELNSMPVGEAEDVAERFKIIESVNSFEDAEIKLI
ncbi:MAG: lasso peptide biosynthesis B2 protein [Chloroflexi bacterium]|nr:lasso peptide biosynthesis B2 protein [Chloroflexota bacterium]